LRRADGGRSPRGSADDALSGACRKGGAGLSARFVVEVIATLDLRSMTGSYRGSGEASYHPQLLLGIMVYGYATGVFSSRRLERATYDSVAFRFVAANEHPDHDTIATFRRRFLKHIGPNARNARI
jgi:transposase